MSTVGCGSSSTPPGGSPALDASTHANDARSGGAIGDAAALSPDTSSVGTDAGAHDSSPTEYDAVSSTPPADWESVTNNLTGLASECGNVGGVYPDPHSDLLVVGIALEGLFASTDGAKTWNSIGKTGATIKNRLSAIVYDPENVDTFWESGIYGWETSTDGIFVTTNNGNSFTSISTTLPGAQTNDSISIDFTDPARKTMLAGTHEQTAVLYLSTNAGSTWSNIGTALPAGLGFCTTTLVLNSTTLLVGCAASWSGKAGAIVRSTDTGKTFTAVHSRGVVEQPLVASDGTIYWAEEGGGVLMSTDQGTNWQEIAASNAAGMVRPLELPDGRIVSAVPTTFDGGASGQIVVAAARSSTWTTIGTPMPFAPVGMSYSPFRNEFFIWYFTCTGANAVPANGIMRFGWDYR
jgi:photosystem II stability/assembly factor-like uncharacterized protein